MTLASAGVHNKPAPQIGPGTLPVDFSETARHVDLTRQREELIRRVASSSSFEKSPRLRAFFLHVCRCALENKPEEATEQQIGIHVYDRSPGYNQNEDNVVRTAARLLRMKLEHHFANEGQEEPVIITIPKGRYLPAFGARSEIPTAQPGLQVVDKETVSIFRQKFVGIATLCGLLVIVSLGYLFLPRSHTAQASASITQPTSQPDVGGTDSSLTSQPVPLIPGTDEVRIGAGRADTYVDLRGRRWESDRYFQGGASRPGPQHFFPPVADSALLKSMREANSSDPMVPQWFRYDIPLHPGAYHPNDQRRHHRRSLPPHPGHRPRRRGP